MSKHTSGPWHTGCFVDPTSKCQCRFILSEGYCGSVAIVSVDNGKNIADGGNDSPPIEEARANARLIAAAPDLLSALKAVLSDYCDHDALIAAQAVVEKAEGPDEVAEQARNERSE